MLSCQTEEVCLEMHSSSVPDDCTVSYVVEFVWKSTSYDRMKVRYGMALHQRHAGCLHCVRCRSGCHDAYLKPAVVYMRSKNLNTDSLAVHLMP